MKDMLDPHKIPRVSSRYHNISPWNVKLMILTNVYAEGVAGYVRDVLHYAPGVTKLGYLKQDDNNKRNWLMKTNDPQAGQIYLSQLSQLLRRLPINVHMSSTNSGKGTRIVVSIINFRPGGRPLQNYDYVYTHDSVHVFNEVINDDLPEEELDKIAITVAKMIDNLKDKAKVVFKNNPNAILDKSNGFLSLRANLGYYLKDGQPLLFADDDSNDDSNNLKPTKIHVSPSVNQNLLTTLQYMQFELWPEIDVATTNFDPNIDQVTALLRGKTAPIRRSGQQWVTMRLTKKGIAMAKAGQVMPIIMRLNEMLSINQSEELFEVGKSNQVARLLPNSSWKGTN